MTDTREQVERLAQLADAWGEVNLAQGREGQSGDMSEIATTLRSLLSRLEAAEAERDILRTEKHADAEALAERDAAVAAAYEAAAGARGMWFGFNSQGEPNGDYCTVKAYDPVGMKLYISHEAIRSLTPADAQTALDRVKAEERERCARVASEQTRSPAFFLTIAEQKSWNGACENIAATIREGK